MSDNAVGALAIVCIFGLPVAAWILIRFLQFIERLEMIKRGITPPPQGSFGWGGRRAYREWQQQYAQQQQSSPPPPQWGPSAGWRAQPAAQQSWAGCDDIGPQGALFKGIRLALIGFAITLGIRYGFGSAHNPMILGGLIPMFVGIAQIIVALLSGAQLPGMGPRATFIPPPPPGAAAPPPPPGAPGPSAWQQPGRPRFEELSKPAPPPDVR